jgi:predicted MPP superfamily phosphohydrolase
MLKQVQSWFTQKSLKKQLLALLDEMEKNLEIYYVMDQRQFIIDGYDMKQWEYCKDLAIVKKHEAIKVYGSALAAFNQAHQEHKEYEQWFSSNLDHKTNDNAKKLHDMKNGVVARIKTLEAIIIPAGQTLEKELLNLGFITN